MSSSSNAESSSCKAVPKAVERVEFVGAGGLRIAADAAGPPDGAPVLLLHGGGQTRHAWRHALQDLAALGWRAIALDARGHGDSAWAADGDYGVDRLGEDLRAVVRSLAAKPVLVGASMGGHTALIAEGETPGLARALILVDVVPQLEALGVQRIMDFMTARPDGFASLEEAADAVAAYNPARARPNDPQGLAKNLRLGADQRWRWHWDPRFLEPDGPRRAERLQEIRSRMAHAASRVKVPTLLLRGAQSDVVSIAGVDALRALLPQLQAQDVDAAGHMVAGDRNDHFNAALRGFLQHLAPAKADAG